MAHSSERQFVICIRNDHYPASLEKRKIYKALPDAAAEKHNQVRVIDESGEDYLYPEEYFVPVKLPKATEEALVSTR
ncbi:MAG: hypothetical protein R6U98_21525 [Pirellulaceae bacterium]